jgi:LmbE family N-acetylglucosaminyl deacetylase/tetratricopeptide (TPR) repeat protein
MRAPSLLAILALIAVLPTTAAENTRAQSGQMTNASAITVSSTESWDRYDMTLPSEGRPEGDARAMNMVSSRADMDTKPLQHHLALVNAWSGNYMEATRRYQRLLRRFPNDSAIRMDYGQALVWGQRYREAAAQYEHILAGEPRNIQALLHLGMLEAWQGRYDLALATIESGLAIDARNPDLVAERANVLSWKGELSAATEAYEELVKIVPENADYWLKLAHVYAWNGHSKKARESYQKVLSLDPGNIDAQIGLARDYQSNRQYTEAEKTMRNALMSSPADARLANELAALAAQKPLTFMNVIELAEPVIFAFILLVLATHIRRERRDLMRRKLTARVLLPALPLLGLLIATAYVDVLSDGPYYHQISTAAQLLKTLAIGALLTLLLVWRLHFERPRRQKTILAIGAHPDDIEFGCGATMLRLREEGAATYGLVLTAGEQGHHENDESKVRVGEARSAAHAMALCDIKIRNFPDTLLDEHKVEIRKAIEEEIARRRPDIIFTHNGHDVHTDHHTVFEATREAARGAYTILCYENPNTPPGFNPGYFFDVGNYIDGKISALVCHKTQMGKSYAHASKIRAMAEFRGTQAHVNLAEGFEVMRVLEKPPIS